MSPSFTILSLAQKFLKLRHSRTYAVTHVLAFARQLGYPRYQARHIVMAVYRPPEENWRSWG
jgi:hypothetical protein